MKLDDHLLLWNNASIKVMDIRHMSMEHGEELRAYRFPANVFLYATRGSAHVWLDGVPHAAQRFHVFHGGKGVCLDIAAKQPFEYFMIMYKATASVPDRKEFMRQLEADHPFHMQFGLCRTTLFPCWISPNRWRTVVGDELQPNMELIASLKPDLIIGNKVRQEKVYEQLKQIAPTVFAEDLAGDWQINFKLYMEAVNKKEEGEKAMTAFNKRVSEVKDKLGGKAATKVSVVRFSASQVRLYQKQTFSGVLLSQLGIARPASQDKDSFIEVMTKEKMPSMDGDVLFYFVSEVAGKTDAAKVVQEWKNDPLFKNLNVSKNNKVIQVDEAIWNSAGGYKAANLLLDEIAAYFEVK